MSVTVESIRASLDASDELAPLSHVDITDISGGCGTAFNIIAVTPAFAEKSLINRHRMMHKALDAHMSQIHALKLKCFTPDKYDQ